MKKIDNKDNDTDKVNNTDKVNKDWSFPIAKRFQDYAFKSAGLSWMYGNDAAHYSSVNNKTNVAIGILASISSIGIAGILALVDNRECSKPNIGFYVLTSITILMTVFIAILNRYQSAMNLQQRVEDYSEKSAKFGSMYRRINNEFNKDTEDRANALLLLENIERRFEELDREKPFIRNKTVDEWGKYLNNSSSHVNMDAIISIPDDLQDDDYMTSNDDYMMSRDILGDSIHNINTCSIRINAT